MVYIHQIYDYLINILMLVFVVIKGIGGIGLGAAQALYFTSCYAFGRIPINLQVVGINGWLPDWRLALQSLNYITCQKKKKIQITYLLIMEN